ncbi:hypothetical protein AYY19_10740 [Photobacterium aquimaris]|uniref:Uncharacterized protein n=1 Tax=Photobacterium aquimaris TaxID=512643 RepID=A0A2T3IK06_9GAMM|nr:hypothetical protein AYY19_10740 [Photobacterium aquimaris]OBU13782.1 hypothetical protein AYY20_10115 [Photobacterium aquimaris]PSU28678.1 hypothetical protein CTM88_11710 [Photobacterium aquimaris]PSW00920.1 hypothetical protein CTM91_09470 [Photobacterium aquimaris]
MKPQLIPAVFLILAFIYQHRKAIIDDVNISVKFSFVIAFIHATFRSQMDLTINDGQYGY